MSARLREYEKSGVRAWPGKEHKALSILQNKELVRLYLSACADEVRRSLAAGKDEYYSPEFVVHSPTGDSSLEEYNQLMRSMVTAFPDGKYECDDIVAEGDKVVGRYHFTGTHKGDFLGIPPTGRKVKIEGICIFKIRDARLLDMWVVNDMLGMMQQLGVVP